MTPLPQQLRRWVIALMLSLSAVAFTLGVHAQAPSEAQAEISLETAGLRLEELANGIYGLIASTDFPPTSPNIAICNGGIVVGSDGVLVVDPFQNEDLANLLFETVATLTDQPIRYVVNSHYHFDHSGGNAAADALDYPVLGRGPIRELMLERNLEFDPNPAPPSIIVNNAGSLWLGDRQVQLTEFDGHSGGTDLIVYVPDADVLMAGDLLFTQRIPFLGDGNIRVWQATLAQLTEDYPGATILPGHGPVSNRTNLAELQGYLEALEAIALAWQAEGLSSEEAFEQTTVPEQYAAYLFQGLFPGNLEVAYEQITLGHDDAATIQEYFQAQAQALKAL